MVHPYQEPYSHEPSHPSIPSPLQTFELSADEYGNIERLHLSLLRTLRRLHEISIGEPRVVSDLTAPKTIQDLLRAGAPEPPAEPVGTPLFLTTEIILDEERNPYIVSVDAHSARHWENLIAFDKQYENKLIEAIQDWLEERPLTIIVDARIRRCYPTIGTVLQAKGATVIRRNIKETARRAERALAQPDEPRTRPCIIEYPFMRGKKRDRNAIAKGADMVIQPFAHLSDQRILALLSGSMPENVRRAITIELFGSRSSPRIHPGYANRLCKLGDPRRLCHQVRRPPHFATRIRDSRRNPAGLPLDAHPQSSRATSHSVHKDARARTRRLPATAHCRLVRRECFEHDRHRANPGERPTESRLPGSDQSFTIGWRASAAG